MVFILTILVAIAFNSLIIYGLHAIFYFEFGQLAPDYYTKGLPLARKPYGEGHLFGYVHYRLERAFGETILKPLMSCPVCMASFHGTWFYWGITQLLIDCNVWYKLLFWVLYTLALAGLNSIVYARSFDK